MPTAAPWRASYQTEEVRMPRLSHFALAALAMRPAPAAVAEPAELSLAEVIARHTDAVGGPQAIERVEGLEFTLHIVEPGFELDAVYRADRTGRMRIDVFAGGERVFTEAHDGQKAWQWSRGEQRALDVSPEGTAALRHGTQLPGKMRGLHELAREGHEVALLGRETLDGTRYYVLRVTLSDGFVTHYYLDPESFLIARGRDFRALHPDLDASKKWLENRWTDYRPVDGVLRSFHDEQLDLRTGQVVQTTTVKSVRSNPEIDPGLFLRP
jgi:hypothetical protein